MSNTAARNIRRARTIVVATDGKRYITRWRNWKDLDALGPDEMPTWRDIDKDAQRLIERKGIKVRHRYDATKGETR